MADDGDPPALIRRFFKVQEEKDLAAWARMWTEDAVMRIPYAPPPYPSVLEGRDSFLPIFRELFAGYGTVSIPRVEVYRAVEDPAVYAAEWDVSIELKATGLVYDSLNFGRFRFRDGRIQEFVNVFDPLKFSRAAGVDLSGSL